MPPSRLHEASVITHRPAGRGYYRLVLHAPGIAKTAVPGQFVMLRVTDTMDPLLARPFGVSSCPTRSSIEVLYRIVGRGTGMLVRARTGQRLTVLGPLGKGFPLPPKETMPVCISGGSGFPPLHFLVLRAGARAHFIAGARTRECLPPERVLRSIRSHVKRLHIATDDGSAGARGTSADLLRNVLIDAPQRIRPVVYACGPHAMLSAAGRIATELQVPCYVSMEERMACGIGACMGCSIPMKAGGYQRACKEGPVFDWHDVQWAEQVSLRMRS